MTDGAMMENSEISKHTSMLPLRDWTSRPVPPGHYLRRGVEVGEPEDLEHGRRGVVGDTLRASWGFIDLCAVLGRIA